MLQSRTPAHLFGVTLFCTGLVLFITGIVLGLGQTHDVPRPLPRPRARLLTTTSLSGQSVPQQKLAVETQHGSAALSSATTFPVRPGPSSGTLKHGDAACLTRSELAPETRLRSGLAGSWAGAEPADEEPYRSYCRVPDAVFGDLEQPGELEALAASRAFNGELIILASNLAGTALGLNLVLSLQAQGISHVIWLTDDPAHCAALHLSPARVTCAHTTFMVSLFWSACTAPLTVQSCCLPSYVLRRAACADWPRVDARLGAVGSAAVHRMSRCGDALAGAHPLHRAPR